MNRVHESTRMGESRNCVIGKNHYVLQIGPLIVEYDVFLSTAQFLARFYFLFFSLIFNVLAGRIAPKPV